MTREELLADINEYITQYKEGIRMEGEQGYKALRAIVELPMEGNIEGVIMRQSFADNSPRELATYAYKMGYEVAMNKVIQTIEKELM